MSVQISYKKQFTFFLILVLIFLVVIEISLRFIEPECNFVNSEVFSHLGIFEKNKICSDYQSISYDKNGPIPYLIPNQYYTHVNINSDGFRGEAISKGDSYLIVFLGGSTTFGIVTSSDQYTIPALIERKFSEKNFDVKVINAGIPGATSIDELYLLETDLLQYQPDLVVMYDGWNDVGSRDQIKFDITYDQFKKNTVLENIVDTSISSSEQKSESGMGILKFLVAIDYKTGLGTALFIRDNLILNSATSEQKIDLYDNTFDSNLNQIEKKLGDNWNSVCELGKEYSFLTVNIVQPSLGTSNRNFSDEETVRMSLSNFRQTDLNYLKNLNIEELKTNCQNILDLRNVFNNYDDVTIFQDEVHVSDFGNQIISERIFDYLFPLVETDLHLTNKPLNQN